MQLREGIEVECKTEFVELEFPVLREQEILNIIFCA